MAEYVTNLVINGNLGVSIIGKKGAYRQLVSLRNLGLQVAFPFEC